jgi:hypothetical protein
MPSDLTLPGTIPGLLRACICPPHTTSTQCARHRWAIAIEDYDRDEDGECECACHAEEVDDDVDDR